LEAVVSPEENFAGGSRPPIHEAQIVGPICCVKIVPLDRRHDNVMQVNVYPKTSLLNAMFVFMIFLRCLSIYRCCDSWILVII
jgi:hypothetical protein